MARTVKPDEYAAKRKEILDAAQRLVIARGYERMSIQDILDELHISSGAFHHYFDSRTALLEALAARMQDEIEQRVLPIVQDPHLPAGEKLRRFFNTVLRQDVTPQARALVDALLRIWFTDDNALIRQKVDAARVERLAPLLTEIIQQGIQEASFTTLHADLAGEVILYLIQGLQYSLARLYAGFVRERDKPPYIESVVDVYDVYMDTIERMLGLPSGFLYRLDAAVIREAIVEEETGMTG
jgi:AcrR family transcriptional regulator